MFNALYKDNYSTVYRLCLSYVSGNNEIADDLAQEVFVKYGPPGEISPCK